MKRVLRFVWNILPIITALYVVSCAKEIAGTDQQISAEQTQADRHRDFIASLGYDTTSMVAFDENYLVEGDIAIPKDYIEQCLEQQKTKQYYYGRDKLVSYEKQSTIKVGMDYTLKTYQSGVWNNALQTAVAKWNAISGSNIRFQVVDYTGSDISIYDWSYIHNPNMNMYFSEASIPAYGSPGATIKINPDYIFPSGFGQNHRVMQIVHLLGHCIGLGHMESNWAFIQGLTPDVYEGSGDYIDGTAHHYNDDSSVMVKDNLKTAFASFSPNDVLAVCALYPPNPNLAISGQATVLTNTESTFTVNAPSDCTNIEWTVWGGGYTIISKTGNSIKIKFTTTGAKGVKAVVTLKGGIAKFEVEKSITVETPSLTAGSIPEVIETAYYIVTQVTIPSVTDAACNIPGSTITYKWQRKIVDGWEDLSSHSKDLAFWLLGDQHKNEFRRIAAYGALSDTTNICKLLNWSAPAILSLGGQITDTIQLNKTRFQHGSFMIHSIVDAEFEGSGYRWTVYDYVNGRWNNMLLMGMPFYSVSTWDYGRQHEMKYARIASTPKSPVAPWSNPCVIIDYGVNKDNPALGRSSSSPFPVGTHDSDFTYNSDVFYSAYVPMGLGNKGDKWYFTMSLEQEMECEFIFTTAVLNEVYMQVGNFTGTVNANRRPNDLFSDFGNGNVSKTLTLPAGTHTLIVQGVPVNSTSFVEGPIHTIIRGRVI